MVVSSCKAGCGAKGLAFLSESEHPALPPPQLVTSPLENSHVGEGVTQRWDSSDPSSP